MDIYMGWNMGWNMGRHMEQVGTTRFTMLSGLIIHSDCSGGLRLSSKAGSLLLPFQVDQIF